MTKKSNECQTLLDAIDWCNAQSTEGGENANLLSGRVHTDIERPDLAIETADGRLIGLEHFRVDHFIKGKNHASAVAQLSNEANKKRKQLVRQFHGNPPTDDIAELLLNTCDNALRQQRNACIMDIVSSLEQGAFGNNGHIKKIPAYLCNLQRRYRTDATVEIGFVIEFHTNLQNLFLNTAEGTTRTYNGELPMFTELYEQLNRISKNVDWIVLASYPALTFDIAQAAIIDCRNGEFSKSMERQGLAPVTYLGLGRTSPVAPIRKSKENQATSYTKKKENSHTYHLMIANNSDYPKPENLMENALSEAPKALQLATAGKPFCATQSVQMLYEICTRLGNPGTAATKDGVYKTLRSNPRRVKLLCEEFEERWQLKPTDD